MRTTKKLLLISMLALASCAGQGTLPVALSCPPSPPLPDVLKQPKSSGPTLSERIERSLKTFEESATMGIAP